MTDPTLRELDTIVAELGDDERRVLVLVARRLRVGMACYGRLDVANDRRDWRHEMREEALDLVVYRAIAELAGQSVDVAEALTRTQARCGELLDEVRSLRAGAVVELDARRER